MISFTSSRAPGYLWLIASALAGLLGWMTGAPFALVPGVVALLWLPVLAAYMPPGWERESQAFQVLGWTVIAVLGVALTGGARSPLTIFLVLGPLTGLAIGRRRLALEAAAFSTLGFFLLLAINFTVGLPQLPENLSGLAAALTLAAILETGMLCASAIVSQRRMASVVVKNELAMKQAEQGLNLRSGVQVPRDLPLALLSVTPQGRIRAVEGAVGLLGHLRVGALLHDSLHHHFPDLDLVALNRGAPQTVETREGQPVILLSRKTENGRLIAAWPSDLGDITSLDKVRAEGDAAVRERTAFFASLSHDLKTPLNAIIGFADMMRSGIRGELPEAYQDYTQIIHESGQDLLLLVEDLLDLAKADAKALRFDFEPVDLAASGASVLRQFAAHAERTGVKVELVEEGEAWAHADARAVRQIWQNLISNAIKYSQRGDKVTLTASRNGDGVYLCVADEGAGMDAADLDRIAKPFAQGRNSSGRVGTGLGLAVVKQFADMHGGQVRIDTEKDLGTSVTVSFRPADPADLSEFDRAAQ